MPTPVITSSSGILNRNQDDTSFIRITGSNLTVNCVISIYDSPPRTLWSGYVIEADSGGTWAIFLVTAQSLFFALVDGTLVVPPVSAASQISVTVTDTATGDVGHGTVTTDIVDVDIIA